MDAARTLARGQQRRLERAAQRLDRAAGQLVSPAQRLEHQRERLNSLGFRLASAWSAPQGAQRASPCSRNAWNIASPTRAARRTRGERRAATGPGHARLRLQARNRLAAGAQLRALDPGNTLARGYAIARDAQGRILRDAASLQPGQALELRFARAARRPKSLRSGRSPTRPEQDAWSGPQAPGSTVSCKANTCCEKRLLGPSPACWPLER